MLASYIRTFLRYSRWNLLLSILHLVVATLGVTGLLLFASGYIHEVPMDSLWKYLLIAVFMVLLNGLLTERRRYLYGNKELAIRQILGAGEMDLLIQLTIETVLLNLIGTFLSFLFLDLIFALLQITKASMAGYFINDVHSLLAYVLLVIPASLLSALIPFLSLQRTKERIRPA